MNNIFSSNNLRKYNLDDFLDPFSRRAIVSNIFDDNRRNADFMLRYMCLYNNKERYSSFSQQQLTLKCVSELIYKLGKYYDVIQDYMEETNYDIDKLKEKYKKLVQQKLNE